MLSQKFNVLTAIIKKIKIMKKILIMQLFKLQVINNSYREKMKQKTIINKKNKKIIRNSQLLKKIKIKIIVKINLEL